MDRLQIVELHKEYEGEPLLKGVNFHVDAGETLCLLGSSGSGKSTILRIIAGIETQDSGSVLWNGVDVSTVPVHQRGFGLMFQDYALFPHLNVAQNVAFGLRMHHVPRAEIGSRVMAALERVNMTTFTDRRVTDLSGGEQQRIALARALTPDPQLLMLDEPLAALDRSLRVELQEELRELLHRTGIPAIYVTHDQEEAILLGDQLALLHEGRIVQSGVTEEVFRQPNSSWVARFLGMTNLLPGKVLSNNPLVVETACGHMLPFTPVQGNLPSPGTGVMLLIKPSAIRSDPIEPCAGSITGSVAESRFLGDHYRVRLGICSGLSLEFVSSTPLPVGQEIKLKLLPGEVMLIPE